MKIGIFRGHNTIYNHGANGILKEEDMINDVAFKLINKLKAAGNIVIDCTPTQNDFPNIHSTKDSLRIRCERANAAKVDIVVSIHFNYYNGQAHGSEIFYVSKNGKNLGEPVLDEIVKLGYTNRGMKKSTSLYVLNNTIAPAILIEGCFCDSIKDTTLFNGEKMATAIYKGLTGNEIIDADLEKLAIKVSELEHEITALESSYSSMSNKLSEFDTKLSSLEDSINLSAEKIEILSSVITTMNQNIASLQNFVDRTLEHYEDILK